jgi:GDP-L-fucose synthase
MLVNKRDKIFLCGHRGLLGSSIHKLLKEKKYSKIITATKSELDLRNQAKVDKFLKKHKPKIIIIAAAKVGGIIANSLYKADFIYDNTIINFNLVNSAFKNKINNLILFGSSCIYPKNFLSPIKEEYLLKSELEKTNEPYAIAKIASLKLCDSYNFQYKTNYKCLMPSNIYGPDDSYNLKNCHFFPALLKKIYLAKINKKKTINLLGTGKALRELIYTEDVADATLYFMNKKTSESLINIGSGFDHSIEYYAKFIMSKLRVKMKINYLKKTPNGTKRKLLDTSLAKKYGWTAKTSLSDGFDITYKKFIEKKYYL